MTRGCKAVALAAATVIGTFTFSSNSSTARADELTLAPQYGRAPLYLDDAPPKPDKPLAGMMKKWGIGTGDIAVYCFAEGSYTYSASSPPNNFISGRVFDIDQEEILLNQLDLTVEKTVDSAAAAKDGKWNLGGKVEVVYGADARFLHSNGLNFYGSASPQLSPENKLDLVQSYVDIAAPIGNGLLVRAGKMVTHMGYETINPTMNPFYSHTYLFGYTIPFTHTGVMAFYNVNDKMTVMVGFSRGWDQALEDNNDSLDYLGQIKYVFDEKLTGYVNVITGPEQFDNGAKYRTVIDGILTYAVNDKLSFAANGDFGWEPSAAADGADAMWYGLAGYAGYKLCDSATLNGRLEWFNDDDGARGIGDTVYEATIGLAIKPMPNDDIGSNLTIRPELRFDYAENGFFDGGTDHYQWTAAIDAIFTF